VDDEEVKAYQKNKTRSQSGYSDCSGCLVLMIFRTKHGAGSAFTVKI
jgi:hypothetical protein